MDMQLRRYALSLLDGGYNKDINCCKFSRANSKEHEMKKAEVCFDVLKKGGFFLTECRFKSGGRADILASTDDKLYAVEIVHSEKEESIEQKKGQYPVELTIVMC